MLLEKDARAWKAGELDVRWRASDAEVRLEVIEERLETLFRIAWETARVSLGLAAPRPLGGGLGPTPQ
jgi:hypothetical protein